MATVYPFSVVGGDTLVELTVEGLRIQCTCTTSQVFYTLNELIKYLVKHRDQLTGDVLPFLMMVKRMEHPDAETTSLEPLLAGSVQELP